MDNLAFDNSPGNRRAHVSAERSDGSRHVYTLIANELTNQYVVGYLSNNARADGAWRRIAVRLQRPNLQARTRAGYYAATP